MYDKRIKPFYNALDFFFSIVRLLTQTHFRRTRRIKKKHTQCIIMGNGPSLKQSLSDNAEKLHNYDLIAVNFMALYPEYEQYKPNIYILCDPAFWFDTTEDVKSKVSSLYENFALKTNWDLQIYLPYQAKKTKQIYSTLSKNSNIQLKYYNKTKVEGYSCFQHFILKRQWGMFRAQNVLNAALLLAVYSQYKTVYLLGADNDWLKNLWVDEKNRLRLSDTHFYGENDCILPEKISERLMDIHFMFKTYNDIEKFAQKQNVKIYNGFIHSFIDAFEKPTRIK